MMDVILFIGFIVACIVILAIIAFPIAILLVFLLHLVEKMIDEFFYS